MRSMTTIGVTIARDYDFVYDFLATPKNLFTWADSLGSQHHAVGPLDWVAEAPPGMDGPVRLRFTPRNSYGVLDIRSYQDDRLVYEAPVRLLRNDQGCELTFGIWHAEGDDAAKRASDIEWQRADLLTIKTLLEQGTKS